MEFGGAGKASAGADARKAWPGNLLSSHPDATWDAETVQPISATSPRPKRGEGQGEGRMNKNTTIARKLRRQQTDAEQILWQRLRSRQLAGCKFRRQHPVGPYVVDFVCLKQGLVVELDGSQHALPEEVVKDAKRTAYLEAEGFRVLRFWNNEVFGEIEALLTRILAALVEGR